MVWPIPIWPICLYVSITWYMTTKSPKIRVATSPESSRPPCGGYWFCLRQGWDYNNSGFVYVVNDVNLIHLKWGTPGSRVCRHLSSFVIDCLPCLEMSAICPTAFTIGKNRFMTSAQPEASASIPCYRRLWIWWCRGKQHHLATGSREQLKGKLGAGLAAMPQSARLRTYWAARYEVDWRAHLCQAT